MKKQLKTILVLSMVLGAAACKKTNISDQAVAVSALNVTNAVVSGSTITLFTNSSIVSTVNTVGGYSAATFPLTGGNVPIILLVPAVAATATTPAVPAITYYNQNLTVDNTTNYSLFLTGTSASAIENVLVKENYPHAYLDSICGVRFINLSPGSNPISVNVKGQGNGSAAANIAYKAYGDFVKYPAKKLNPSYIFEFRDAVSGNLLTSYTLVTPYFHNVTLALRGPAGGALGIIPVTNY